MSFKFSPQALARITAIAMTVVLILAFMAIPVFAEEGIFFVFPEQTVFFDYLADSDVSFIQFTFPDSYFVVGDKFQVIIDGLSFIAEVKSLGGLYYVGNLQLLDIVNGTNDFSDLYSNENFLFVPFDIPDAEALCSFYLMGQHESVTLEISLYERAPGDNSLDLVSTGIGTVISWAGLLISSVFSPSGELFSLSVLFAVGIAVSAILFGVKIVRYITYGL